MPRKPRIFSPSFAYHIISRGNNRKILFHKSEDYFFFLSILRDLKEKYSFDVFHYCLMSNHVHLLMRFDCPLGFQKVPQRLFLLYAKYFARNQNHIGHVFQDRFKSLPVNDNTYLLECGRYIERNPVKAGLVRKPEEYSWSSYAFYSQERKNDILTTNPAYMDLAARPAERTSLYRTYVETDRPYDGIVERELFGREKVAP